jgi:hypothetical protein
MLHRSLLVSVTVAAVLALVPGAAAAKPFVDRFGTIGLVASTVPTSGPAAGDQNPYGVAVVPRSAGSLVKGDVLVSNFNDVNNNQGNGTSIMQISPTGAASVFAIVPTPGLTTALVALRSGFVVVGSLPAPGGMSANATAGALTILDSGGNVVGTIENNINGPWDMTADDDGANVTLFVTNVLNDTVADGSNNEGNVVRIVLRIAGKSAPQVISDQVIATGFPQHTDPNALVVGPTGVALGDHGTLYVADSAANRIAAIPDALKRTTVLGGGGNTVSTGSALNDPLGLAIAPGGDILTVNGQDGNIVETTPKGSQVASKELVANGGGDLFGLALAPGNRGVYFVNDIGSGPAANSLELLH